MTKIDVTFDSAGITLAGNLYTPDGPAAAGPHPAIVVGHPGSGVNEQAAGLYASQLAERGFVALAFDAAYQGKAAASPAASKTPPTGSRTSKPPSPTSPSGPRPTRADPASAPPSSAGSPSAAIIWSSWER